MIKNKYCNPSLFGLKSSKYEASYIHLSKGRTIFLKEDLTKEVAAELSALLLYYDHVSNEEISLYLNSNGGDADALMNVYDVMMMIKSPIQTVCIGKAYSAAAVLLAAGTKGRRLAYKNCKIMLHGVQCLFPLLGDDQIRSKSYFDFLKANNDVVMQMLSDGTGQSLEQVKLDCSRDLFLDANQAIKYGVIDEIV